MKDSFQAAPDVFCCTDIVAMYLDTGRKARNVPRCFRELLYISDYIAPFSEVIDSLTCNTYKSVVESWEGFENLKN